MTTHSCFMLLLHIMLYDTIAFVQKFDLFHSLPYTSTVPSYPSTAHILCELSNSPLHFPQWQKISRQQLFGTVNYGAEDMKHFPNRCDESCRSKEKVTIQPTFFKVSLLAIYFLNRHPPGFRVNKRLRDK